MKPSVLHKASTRYSADHGWLQSAQTFSFHGHYDPERVQFGVLRVLNDDMVNGGKGFGEHPHDNMEIISIPLLGTLEHQDSMGNTTLIRPGEIQVMSAGTGIYHTEYNYEKDRPVSFLQIWLYPNVLNVEPRYDQQNFEQRSTPNELHQILSPAPEDEGVWIHQNAWFHIGRFDAGTTAAYDLKARKNGIYVFVIEGNVEVDGQELEARDGYGIWPTESVQLKAINDSYILIMEVPEHH